MAQKSKKELNFEQKHMEDLQRLQGFRLLDDDFMSKVFTLKIYNFYLSSIKIFILYITFFTLIN